MGRGGTIGHAQAAHNKRCGSGKRLIANPTGPDHQIHVFSLKARGRDRLLTGQNGEINLAFRRRDIAGHNTAGGVEKARFQPVLPVKLARRNKGFGQRVTGSGNTNGKNERASLRASTSRVSSSNRRTVDLAIASAKPSRG